MAARIFGIGRRGARALLAVFAVALAVAATRSRAADWIEGIDGDLSNDRLAPSQLTLTSGSNRIQGGFGTPDLDYLTIIVPTGVQLTSIVTGPLTNPGLSRSFIGMQIGAVMTVTPSSPNAVGLLGWTHYGSSQDIDLLPAMRVPNAGSTGFSGPLNAGTYAFWINETSTDPGLAFDFDFQVTPVPLPAALPLLGSTLLAWASALGLRRRPRRNAVA